MVSRQLKSTAVMPSLIPLPASSLDSCYDRPLPFSEVGPLIMLYIVHYIGPTVHFIIGSLFHLFIQHRYIVIRGRLMILQNITQSNSVPARLIAIGRDSRNRHIYVFSMYLFILFIIQVVLEVQKENTTIKGKGKGLSG